MACVSNWNLIFRDTKQFWGLEDFLNISQTAVTNAASLS
jgi:putative transposase